MSVQASTVGTVQVKNGYFGVGYSHSAGAYATLGGKVSAKYDPVVYATITPTTELMLDYKAKAKVFGIPMHTEGTLLGTYPQALSALGAFYESLPSQAQSIISTIGDFLTANSDAVWNAIKTNGSGQFAYGGLFYGYDFSDFHGNDTKFKFNYLFSVATDDGAVSGPGLILATYSAKAKLSTVDQPAPVPVPAALPLLGSGMIAPFGLVALRRKRVAVRA